MWQELCSTTLNSNLSSWEMTCDTEKLHLASHLSNKISCNGLKSFLKLDLLTHFISILTLKIRKNHMQNCSSNCWQNCPNYLNMDFIRSDFLKNPYFKKFCIFFNSFVWYWFWYYLYFLIHTYVFTRNLRNIMNLYENWRNNAPLKVA